MTHIIKHLEGAVKRTHPKPLNSRERRESLPREEGGSLGDEICVGEKKSPEENSKISAVVASRRLGHGRGHGEEKETAEPNPRGVGYMGCPRGHRTLFMWHRTRPMTTGLKHRELRR